MSGMFKSISKLFSASIIAQGIQFSGLPLIARLYDPEAFSLYAQINSLVSFFVVIALLQLHLAIIAEKKDKREVIQLAILSSFFVSCITLFFSVLININYTSGNYFLPVVFSILIQFISLSNLLKGELNSKQEYNKVSFFIITRSILCITFQILFSYLSVENGLVIGLMFSEIIVFVAFSWSSRIWSCICIKELKTVSFFRAIKNRRDYTIFGTLQELISTASFLLPIIMIPIVFDTNNSGQFAMIHRIMWAATVALSMAVSQVLLYRYSNVATNLINNAINKDFRVILLVILVISPAVYYYIDEVVLLILSDKWKLASDIAPYLMIWCLAFLISIPYRVCYKVLLLQKKQLLIEVLFISIISILLFFNNMPFFQFVIHLCAVGVIQNCVISLYAKIKISKVAKVEKIS
ncbi:TPA: oligosaccharide flippase family protein [Vibrio vulnificus]|nr:oligosaccharide flippase family protein [Vibrio vulnificus]